MLLSFLYFLKTKDISIYLKYCQKQFPKGNKIEEINLKVKRTGKISP